MSNETLDFVLLTLIKNDNFQKEPSKNWNSISNIIPKSTAKLCEERYYELLAERNVECSTVNDRLKPLSSSSDDQSRKPKRNFAPTMISSRSENSKKITSSSTSSANMVIHVCDEAKSLKQDFTCPRDLLVKEMKYFAEYLSTDSSQWEEVDISVHCDVHIFDWLMRHVKRGQPGVKPAKLESTNVVSILISSDFLKMNSLVEKCISFCHDNMAAIVATPCNMNCLGDKLITALSNTFTPEQLEDLFDKRDKIRSKLFSKKLEQLFEGKDENSASTLFRCSLCENVITHYQQNNIPCIASRICIDGDGSILFRHQRDPCWDINTFVLSLYKESKSWREVYWRIWMRLNTAECSRCQQTFQFQNISYCAYHSFQPTYQGYAGVYPCCGQRSFRFRPITPLTGCRFRDHAVSADIGLLNKIRASIHVNPPNAIRDSHECYVFANEVLLNSHENPMSSTILARNIPSQMGDDDSSLDSDEMESTSAGSQVWSAKRSLRWNQDAQREDDFRRIAELSNELIRMRIHQSPMDKKEHPAGIYARVDQQMRLARPAMLGKDISKNKQKMMPPKLF